MRYDKEIREMPNIVKKMILFTFAFFRKSLVIFWCHAIILEAHHSGSAVVLRCDVGIEVEAGGVRILICSATSRYVTTDPAICNGIQKLPILAETFTLTPYDESLKLGTQRTQCYFNGLNGLYENAK